MKLTPFVFIFSACLTVSAVQANPATLDGLLKNYATQGADAPEATRGEKLWTKTYPGKGEFKDRSCSTCHGRNLTQVGKHVRTGKAIEPMSPAVNPERLTDKAKIEKWFKRNCKWTLGRECTPQEKADFLLHIDSARNI